MATITLKYDARNPIIKNAIAIILAAGGERVRSLSASKASKKSSLDIAVEQYRNGDVIECEDFHDYLQKVNG